MSVITNELGNYVFEHINRENLQKLAEYLKDYRTKYQPLLNSKFDMLQYLKNKKGMQVEYAVESNDCCIAEHYCGTAACAVGHAPAATGILGNKLETWDDYTRRVLGRDTEDGIGWRWLFSGVWAYRDNTPEGAAFRIFYFLKYGCPPGEVIANVLEAFDCNDNGYAVLPKYEECDSSYLLPVGQIV